MKAILIVLLFVSAAHAELGAIRIDGKASATVAKARVSLSDIADVYSAKSTDDEAVIALRGINLASSPQPGRFLEITSDEVLAALRAAQVDLNQVGYKLPRSIVVTRAARSLGEAEIRASIEHAFTALGREVIVHSVDVPDPFLVEAGPISLKASLLASTGRNRASMLISAKGESTETKGKVLAAIEEWKNVAVAARGLQRGSIVGPEDVAMARLQSHLIPADTATRTTAVVGLALQAGISAGEAFSNQKLLVPPVITAGSKITMLIKIAGLEATASGIALESGVADQRISVRNEASKKLVTGRVVEPGLVIVSGDQ